MMAEYIKREDAINAICNDGCPCKGEDSCVNKDCVVYNIVKVPAADVVELPSTGIGDLSDGSHTFNWLYYQRMVLFSALVTAYPDRSWKSWKHEDGEPCFGGGWFIVGIDTPEGSYTYHYKDKDWNLFDCAELPVAKHWDGHTEKDVTRLLTLPDVVEREAVCPHYIRNVHDRGDDSLCGKYRCEVETEVAKRKKTNADRIRSMTDEDLALSLAKISDCEPEKCVARIKGCMECEETCACAWHEWLKQEVTE